MTITPVVRISDGKLIVKGQTILSGVPDNVITSSASSSGPSEGIFLGALFNENKSKHVVPLGTLSEVRFLSIFRFKLWWMAQRMGNQGKEIPLETQFLLFESNSEDESKETIYTVLLPLIDGPFRSCLQGNSDTNELELKFESGDSETKASSFTHSLFVNCGSDPFSVITDSIAAAKKHLGSFRQRHEKKLPEIVDYFGWCTWDAFYQSVTQEGVEDGLKSLSDGGVSPKFVIIDDGWQSVGPDPVECRKDPTLEPINRITGIKENDKFKDKEDKTVGIEHIVKIAKEKYGLKYVYVWHAITGYWGGVHTNVEGYNSSLTYPNASDEMILNDPTWKIDPMLLQGLGLVTPKKAYKFYNEMHEYLASSGVDGVKVDVQAILETLGGGIGGRVQLTRQYHQALDASVAKNFPGNGIIACMSHNADSLYCSKQTAVVRASDDFYPRDPVSHTIHIASVSFNSVFLGEFMHPSAEYHASARAISGGPVYVSDAPGKHNFEVLRKLVLPDGSVLRARLPGRPTKDCLFADPTRDNVSLLKIWNMNKYTGVLGVYNCQGAAWSDIEKKNAFHETETEILTGAVKGSDVHLISEAAIDSKWNGDCAVYHHQKAELVTLSKVTSIPISLKILEHEIFTVTPIKEMGEELRFAPIGLIDMYNAGGAIAGLIYEEKCGQGVGRVMMEVKGCGRLGAYSSVKPSKCVVGSENVGFDYDFSSGLLSLNLNQLPEGGKKLHVVEFEL
ncbi:galactinol--sucrose galactosyltransferase [Ranunculus cassubicifolius]